MNVWAPGILLGPYELIGHIGAGGMGEVWKACDTRVDRVVAIKRLKSDHTERVSSARHARSRRSIIRGSVNSTTLGPTTW